MQENSSDKNVRIAFFTKKPHKNKIIDRRTAGADFLRLRLLSKVDL